MSPLSRELEVAERLAREAGALTLRYFGTGVGVEYKAHDEGPVTIADREASDLIVAGLARAFPDDGILSEEAIGDGSWSAHERVWMIDPLDGTRDFIRGGDGYSVMIGLCREARPVLGVVYQPRTGLLYRAAQGHPAEAVFPDGHTEAMRVSTTARLEDIRLVASLSHRTPTIDRVRQTLGVRDEFNIGSVGLKLALIARGERDLYVNPASRSSLWDSAAPQALLEGAGGRLTDLAGGALVYTGPNLKNDRGLIASNGHLHEAVVEKLAALFPNGRTED